MLFQELSTFSVKMVHTCSVVGCKNRSSRASSIRFHRFPLSDGERCAKWVAAVRRLSWNPNVHTRICSAHFVTGKLELSSMLK